MEPKFKQGDLLRVKTSGSKVIVINYKINYAGGLINRSLGKEVYPKETITDDVLCEGTIDGKFQRKYIKEYNLELWQDGNTSV